VTLSHKIKLFAGPLTAIIIWLFFDLMPENRNVTYMAGIALWMGIWWLTEVVPLAVTSLLPLILYPILGIADSKITSTQYMDNIIFLFIGGFIIAFAIEKWNLHKRVALLILKTVGTNLSKVLFGVMLTAFFLSMWISNTATVMMLISASMAIIYQLEKYLSNEDDKRAMAAALLIGLSYASTIGGMSTLVGTPTNMIFYREFNVAFPDDHSVTFFKWFQFAFPIACILLLTTFFVLLYFFRLRKRPLTIEPSFFKQEYKQLGKMSYEEKVVSFIFLTTAILWFTRERIELGSFVIPGWSGLFKNNFIHDSTVAIVMAVLLFLIPSKTEKGRALITWNEASKLPFDVLLLFGGGFALAKGFEVSGLSTWFALKLNFAIGVPPIVFILIMCLLITVVSEFASNVACIQLMIPIILALQKVMDVPPLLLLVPATLAASLGFMLPVATAPNTIVYSSKRIKASEMFKVGFLIDLAGILIIGIVMLNWGKIVWKF